MPPGLRAQKIKSQQHSRTCPRARFIFNARNICRLSCGRPEVVHCRTYVLYCYTCYREKQNSLEAARINRIERTIARRACRSKALWPQSVPGWLPSCERLPPASWAVVGLGVEKMASFCAVECCAEYSCSGPSMNSAAVFTSRK